MILLSYLYVNSYETMHSSKYFKEIDIFGMVSAHTQSLIPAAFLTRHLNFVILKDSIFDMIKKRTKLIEQHKAN